MRIYPDQLAERTAVLCVTYLRQHAGYATDSETGLPIVDFNPPLSVAEQATYADILALARSRYDLTLAEYQSMKPHLASEVAWMAITRNAFVNMSDADMRRAVYDIITAEVRLARLQRRDG